MRIHITTNTGKKKYDPRVGDRKTNAKGQEFVRLYRMAYHPGSGEVIGYQVSSGRQLYDWVPIEQVDLKLMRRK